MNSMEVSICGPQHGSLASQKKVRALNSVPASPKRLRTERINAGSHSKKETYLCEGDWIL